MGPLTQKFNFQPKIHYEIGKKLGLINFEIASKLSGSRFVLLKKQNFKT
jgi:Seryl-tRNA synthetase